MYSTQTEVVAALIQLGMSEAYAKAAVNQQYKYDETDDLLRGNDEDLSITHIASVNEVKMVKVTWEEMLSTEGNTICVDGHPTYNLEGNLL